MNDLTELYRQKGELTTRIEIAQAKLRAVNESIVNFINSQNGKKEENVISREKK